MYVVLTFVASIGLALAGPLGVPGEGEDLLMDRILEQIPRFFTRRISASCWTRRA
jgi:hypothetical protein